MTPLLFNFPANCVRGLFFLTIFFCNSNLAAQPSTQIGSQVWTSINLNVNTFRNGDTIPEAKTSDQWMQYNAEKKAAWCYYDNDPVNGSKYGKLYNWYAVNDQRGLAPKGWHLPTDAEWTILSDYLGGADTSGRKMKTSEGWNNNGNGNNSSGFVALPGGYRFDDGRFNAIGDCATWWSSTEKDIGSAWGRGLYNYRSNVYRGASTKSYGLYVRCVSD